MHAQQPGITDTTAKKQINILHADKISYKKVDSLNEYQILVGHVAVQQEKTLFYCDSASINTKSNILEAFGKVHINDNDSLHIYSDYLKYLGKEKKATLTGKVSLTDGKGTLTTSKLDYDLNTHIGNYYDGGKVVNGKTVLTSKEGFYYEDTRDVYFKKDVVLTDPEYTIKTDTLLYNTYTGISTFVVPTVITSDSGRKVVKTKDGYYDTKNKKTYFGQRTEIQDGATFIVADEMASDDSTGFGEARGKVIYRDTAQKVTIFANHLNSNRKNSSFLATEKPVMILEQEEGDSLFIAADTMYSARLSDLKKYRNVPVIIESKAQQASDTAISTIKDTASSDEDNTDVITKSIAQKKDTVSALPAIVQRKRPGRKELAVKITDTINTVNDTAIIAANTFTKKDTTVTVKSVDSTIAPPMDSAALVKMAFLKKDMALQNKLSPKDTAANKNDSTNRFFEAYYHVRIFSDSLQAAGDSLFYSGEDSAFRLFKQPIVWARESQVTGDTIYLFTQNKKPSRLYVFENAFTVNKVGTGYYNQIRGRTINGYFKNGNMDYMRAKGNSESIYYAQDEDNKFIGVNKATADIIDMYFEERKPQKVVFRSNLVGTTYPMRQVNHDELRLRGFKWLDDLRPKTKYELFAN
ncbi:OstA-like protein [Panacibacter ginsenosidivorans]|nr:OstA-like protein [Panacibacter ginsenosidivorans]